MGPFGLHRRRWWVGVVVTILVATGIWFFLVSGQRGIEWLPNDPWTLRGLKKPSPAKLSKPYRRVSMKGWADEKIARFFGEGRTFWQLEGEIGKQTRLPPGFWDMEPKKAALALADWRRHPKARRRFPLRIDDMESVVVPKEGSLFLGAFGSAAHIQIGDGNASLWLGGFAYSGTGADFMLRRFPVDPAVAQRVMEVVCWLKRIWSTGRGAPWGWRSHTPDEGSMLVRNEQGAVIDWIDDMTGLVEPQYCPVGAYSEKLRYELIDLLVTRALPERLGISMDSRETPASQEHSGPDEARQHVRELVGQYLDRYLNNRASASPKIVAQTIDAVGWNLWGEFEERVRGILDRLGSDADRKRRHGEIFEKLVDLQTSRRSRHRETPFKVLGAFLRGGEKGQWGSGVAIVPTPEERALIVELIELSTENAVAWAARDTAKMLSCAENADALVSWLRSEHNAWARPLRQLAKVDKRRCEDEFLAGLKRWMVPMDPGDIDELWRADPTNIAHRILDAFGPEDKGPGVLQMFARLLNERAITEGDWRFDALLSAAGEAGGYPSPICTAIDALVPESEPMRYPSPNVDAALVRRLKRSATGSEEFGRAASALILRGRTEYLEHIANRVLLVRDAPLSSPGLKAVALMTQRNPDIWKGRLSTMLRPHLERGIDDINGLVLLAWAADVRDCRKYLERLATSGPQDVEGDGLGWAPRRMRGRYHIARKVLAIWNEEDPLARGRALIAFGVLGQDGWPVVRDLATRWRFETDLRALVQALAPAQLEDLRAFLVWLESRQRTAVDPGVKPQGEECLKLARATLGM